MHCRASGEVSLVTVELREGEGSVVQRCNACAHTCERGWSGLVVQSSYYVSGGVRWVHFCVIMSGYESVESMFGVKMCTDVQAHPGCK